MVEQLPSRWSSERLLISDVEVSDIAELQSLYDTSRYIQQWDGQENEPNYVKNCLEQGNLPPGGTLKNYRIQSIRTAVEDRKIGLLSVYHGYPAENVLYLEFLYIQSGVQKQGYGQEMMSALSRQLTVLGYHEIRINVALKNWPALRFWFKSGFSQISGIYGDTEHTSTNFANMELIKNLL
ncbi:GNAT family N-acetyltransferase [Paenibacillus silvae]|uniref:GNAT family N-acetyltransferase n=1 Tax=Paenibacillus silvae TaxID=1325358 RepID=UPI0020061628|nr:GNAT family N-acetyltransferase [Paenibacillus silvae]